MDLVNTLTTFLAGIALTISGFFGSDPTLGAQPALTVPQGGTGWSNIQSGTYLTGNGTGRLATSTCVDITGSADLCDGNDATGGGGGGSGTVSTSSSETSGRVPFWTSTGATPATLSGGVAGFDWNDTFKRLTATYSSSTVSSATTFYGALVGNADTATALAADPANCSAGNAPLGIIASGAVEGCFDVWTEAENTSAGYVVGTRALTIAGTANQITSSAGSQTLAADRTWTLSLPSHVIFPGSYFAATGTTTNATSTQLDVVTHLRSEGTTRLDQLTSALLLTGATGVAAEYTGAACTNQVIEDLDALGAPTCRTITSAYVDSTISTFAYPFTPATSWVSTSTIYLNTAGIMSTASSSIAFLDTVNGTTTNATSTFNSISSHLRVAGTAKFDSFVGIGRGPNSPILLTVGTTTGASNPTLDNTVVNFVGGDGGPFRLQLDTFNNNTTFGSQITARRSRGTGAVPSAVLANDTIFTLAGSGYGASQYGNSVAQLSIGAAQTWTNTSNPTFWRFFTTPINSVTSVEAVRINEDGQVGVGTTSPRWGVTIASSTGPQIAFADGSLTSNIWTMRNMRGTLFFASSSPTTYATSSVSAMEIRDSLGAGLGVATSSPWRTLSVVGTVGLSSTLTSATGGTNQTLCIDSSTYEVKRETTTVCAVSSRKFKHDIKTLDLSGIDTISQLSPVQYSYNDDVASDYKNVKLGFIAEEVAAVDPHLAEYGEDGKPRNLDDRAIVSVVVQALKELIGWNNTQDARLDALEKRIVQLEEENESLKHEIH